MKIQLRTSLLVLLVSTPLFATVTVSSPKSGVSATSPVSFVATATASTCKTGVAAIGVYVDNTLAYKVNGASLNTKLSFSSGSYAAVVQEWDNCGGSTSTPVTVSIPGNTENGVKVTSPANNSTDTSPVTFTATAGSTTCATGVAAIGVYVDNTLVYKVNGESLNTKLTMTPGAHGTTVQEWDNCGKSLSTPVDVIIPGGKNGVTVTSPANNSVDPTTVAFAATAATTTCASGVAAMGIYVGGTLAYQVNGSSLSTKLTLKPGAYTTSVQEWDNCGKSLSTAVNITVQNPTPPTVDFTATSSTIVPGGSATLRAVAANATKVVISGSNGTSYTLTATGGTQLVTPTATTTYTAAVTGSDGNTSATATVTVEPASDLQKISHVVFMLQENRTFDSYFGMLNVYRKANGWNVGSDGKTYNVDGIDDKLSTISNETDEGASYKLFKLGTTCIDDASSAWVESYGDVSRWNFTPQRGLVLDGFVHTAENFAKSCLSTDGLGCAGTFTDTKGQRAMGYYDEGFLNYYYFMASQFAVSDRWFSPVASESIPNRIATFTGGTTQGLVFNPGANDHLPQLSMPTIFQELDTANVSWKIYYTVTNGSCLSADDCTGGAAAQYPATDFSYFNYANKYLYENPTGAACTAPTQKSSVVGDASNSFCIDTDHIAPLSTYYTDLTNNTLPSFSFIEAGYGNNDEHPGSGQSILTGQAQVANIVKAFTASPEWKDSVFFLSYDEGGGPYDHVVPVPGASNLNTDASLGAIPDVTQIAVNADSYKPCLPAGGTPTTHCDLLAGNPGASSADAPAQQGFAAQLGFRVPNMVISPFTRKHFVSHTPMDHTAIIKFVENRFIGSSTHLTARDAAQPDLLEFFDFTGTPWSTAPTPPTPVSPASLGYDPCTPTKL